MSFCLLLVATVTVHDTVFPAIEDLLCGSTNHWIWYNCEKVNRSSGYPPQSPFAFTRSTA